MTLREEEEEKKNNERNHMSIISKFKTFYLYDRLLFLLFKGLIHGLG